MEALVHAQASYDRARTFRARLLGPLVVVTLAGAAELLSPVPAPAWLHVLVRAAWGLGFLTFGVATSVEWRWYSHKERLSRR